VVSNGKTYFEQDLKEVIDHHDRSGAIVTMVLVPYRPGDPYNPVFLDSDNNVTGFARNPPKQVDTSCLGTYTGVQILEPEVLDWIPPGASDSVNQIYPKLMRKGYAIQGFMSESFWCECSTVERYLCNSLAVLKRRGGENLASTGLPPGCHGAILGDDVLVPSDTVVENSILWNGIKLGRGSSFQGVIITDGVEELPPDTHLQNVVVTPVLEDMRTFQRLPRIGDHYSLWPVS
jgi:mannose-1-phosphate guanylyltransferase